MDITPTPTPRQPPLGEQPLTDVIAACKHERSNYRSSGTDSSEACVELFRRAFAGDQEAWAAVYSTFEGLVRAWIGAQRAVETDDALQEALANFACYAPRHAQLVAGDQLAPLLEFLRRCAKTAVLRLLRRERELLRASLGVHHVGLDSTGDLPAEHDLSDEVSTRLDLLRQLREHIHTADERLVFDEHFVLGRTPREILRDHPDRFSDIAFLYGIIQRIGRRLRKDETIRGLYSAVPRTRQKDDRWRSHEIEIRMGDETGSGTGMETRCELDDDLLLDYVLGIAPATVRAAVERSAACLAAAKRVAGELEPLLEMIYRARCPDEETLVAYQERRLEGTEQLVVHRHVAECPSCRDELRILDAMSEVPIGGGRTVLRRLVEALFQPPLAQPRPLRGTTLHYATPQVAIHLSTRKTAGHPRSWTLRGQVRTPAGRLYTGLVEAVALYSFDQPDLWFRSGDLENGCKFVVDSLEAGAYRLTLVTAEEEIVIRRIVVGDEE
jgi:hypothetical protein